MAVMKKKEKGRMFTFTMVLFLLIGLLSIVKVAPNVTADMANINDFEQTSIGNNTDGIWSISWSPDSSKIVVGLRDSTVVIMDASTGNKLKTLSGHTEHVYSVDWSQKGDKIISGSWDSYVKIWDATTGNLLQDVFLTNEIRAVSWSPNGNLAAAGGSYDNRVRIINATTGNIIENLTGHTGSIESFAWSPDGSLLASGSGWMDTTIRIWDTVTWTEVKTLTGHNGEVSSLDWSSDGSMLLSTEGYAGGTPDKKIHIWDVTAGTIIRDITTNLDVYGLYSADFSPDDSKIVSGTWEINDPEHKNLVLVWDTNSGTLLNTFYGHTYGVLSTKWSPDGMKIASGSLDRSLRIWGDITSPTLTGVSSIGDISGELNAVNISKDSNLVINFTASETGTYEIVIDTDGNLGFNNLTDKILTGIVIGEPQTVLWDMTEKTGLNVTEGNYSVQISITDSSGNIIANPDTSIMVHVYNGEIDSEEIDSEEVSTEDPIDYLIIILIILLIMIIVIPIIYFKKT